MRLNTTRSKTASVAATVAVAALALTACNSGDDAASDSSTAAGNSEESQASAANKYPGDFTVRHGDSTFRVGLDEFRHETVSVTCRESDGLITATVTESTSGNTFTTTQPEGGTGYAGGTLTLGDGSGEYTWVPLDGIDADDIRGDAQIFEDESQSGSPVLWNPDGTADFGTGIRQETDEGELRVQAPGLLDCSGGAAVPE